MAQDFISPCPSKLVHGFFQLTLPAILPRLGVVGIDYDPTELERLRSMSANRLLLTPNHPTNTESVLMFKLSILMQHPFFYLASREAFEPLGGLWGEVIRRVGAYSIIRGTVDRASFRMTRELLAKPGGKVVVFPEGEIYSQNDTLLPFHTGIFQLAFWALEDGRKAGQTEEPLFVVPIAIKYRFVCDMTSEIQASLTRLEKAVRITSPSGGEDYVRLRAIAQAMLRSLEREYQLGTPKEADDATDLTPRLNAVKEAILLRVAAAAGVALPKGHTLPERMRALIHVIGTVTRDDPMAPTPYDTELKRHQQERSRPLLRDLSRLTNWIAAYDGYVRADPSQERMVDTLTRLERECFRKEKINGPRVCKIRMGEPIDLNTLWEEYETNRRTTVARVTQDVENRVAALLGNAFVPQGLKG